MIIGLLKYSLMGQILTLPQHGPTPCDFVHNLCTAQPKFVHPHINDHSKQTMLLCVNSFGGVQIFMDHVRHDQQVLQISLRSRDDGWNTAKRRNEIRQSDWSLPNNSQVSKNDYSSKVQTLGELRMRDTANRWAGLFVLAAAVSR